MTDLRHKFNYPEDYQKLGVSSFAQEYVSIETAKQLVEAMRLSERILFSVSEQSRKTDCERVVTILNNAIADWEKLNE